MTQLYHVWACTQMILYPTERCLLITFLAAVFTTARKRKQLSCPSVSEWILKIWHIYTIEFYSVVKRNKSIQLIGKWMELENIIPPEARPTNTASSLLHVDLSFQVYMCESMWK